eukprot:12418531-Karenia_brevis.AAC.1
MWGGHLARMKTYDDSRMSHQVFLFKNWAWINSKRSKHGDQQHHRRLKVWRWERPLYKYFAPEPWEPKAENRKQWQQEVCKMVAWSAVGSPRRTGSCPETDFISISI